MSAADSREVQSQANQSIELASTRNVLGAGCGRLVPHSCRALVYPSIRRPKFQSVRMVDDATVQIRLGWNVVLAFSSFHRYP